MLPQTILIAEPDHGILEMFPRMLSDHLSEVTIDMCSSAEELCRKCRVSSYDTIAISPILLQAYRFLTYKRAQQSVTPLILTVGREDRSLARRYLERDAFDLIIKPMVPHEAVQTVGLALWQNRLRGLLAAKERASERFRQHMQTFPHALKAQQEFASKIAAYERTFQALQTSMRLLLNGDDQKVLLDMAASVERITRERALDRLLNMCKENPSH